MKYVDKLLAQGEKVVFVTRSHWIHLLPTILVDVGVGIVLTALSIAGAIFFNPLTLVALILLLVPLGHFFLRFTNWRNDQYIVTNRRVMEVKGTWEKYVSDSSLEKINDVVMTQSGMGRLLDYGDVRVITGSDVGMNVFQRIAHPIRFKVALLDQKSTLSGTPVLQRIEEDEVSSKDVPELLDMLDDLRQRGVLTDEEFEREKEQLLERL